MGIDSVVQRLSAMCGVSEMGDGIRVTTQVLYPSSGLVRVYIRGGSQTVIVSDDGESLGEATAAGIYLKNPDRMLRQFVGDRGLTIKDGALFSPRVSMDAAHVSVIHVANVARDVAHWAYEHAGIKRSVDFKALLARYLETSFREQVSADRIHGASTKAHKFVNVVSFSNGRKLIVDPVANDPGSISARVLANLDVKESRNPNIVQRIIYDDSEQWSPADLTLLMIGATPVPFSQAKIVIPRIANELGIAA
jgi:hypothetical protein